MSFYIGRVRLVLSFPLAAIMTVVILTDTTQTVIVCCSAAILHECGHLAAMRHIGIAPRELRMSLFDIAIDAPKKQSCSTKDCIFIDLAGVAVNLICCTILTLVYLICQHRLILTSIVAHFMLFAFNILPVVSLDGGHALVMLLSQYLGEDRADKILDIISFILLFPLMTAGFLLLLQSKYNFTLLLSGLYLAAVLLKRVLGRRDWRQSED